VLRKLLAKVGIGGGESLPPPPRDDGFAPYADAATNHIYNLLFCDAPEAFRARPGSASAPWQTVLFGAPADARAIAALAHDASAEGRVRLLAFNWLRQHGHAVPAKQVLGVIVEVRLPGGLDTLAAFAEGGVRYINQTGRMSFFESVEALQPLVAALFEAAAATVAQISPWDGARLPPPSGDHVRLTFLVSDGLYFGEGPMQAMQREALGGPVIARAGALLQAVVDLTTTQPAS
jgi:hypothetical protein